MATAHPALRKEIEEPTVSELKETKVVLQPTRMRDAFFLVPEEHVENPSKFLSLAYEVAANPTAPALTLRTIWHLIVSKWRGETLPDKLAL